MNKTDLKKELGCYRPPVGRFQILEIPTMRFLMVDGVGDPNSSPVWNDTLQVLFNVSYTLKFMSKRTLEHDYVVMPLEALWWADDMNVFTGTTDKTRWHWTAMIAQPDWITAEMITEASNQVSARHPEIDLAGLRFEEVTEGLCVQRLFIGAYDDEAPVLKRLHDEFIPANGLLMTGHHHEIYLSDARRVAPEKLKTILRQPVARN